MQEHPLIELYITHGDATQSAVIEQTLSTLDLDAIVLRTLEIAGIHQKVMLTLMITDDEGIREMNKQYREQDKATDVLSFPLIEKPIVDAPAEQLWTPTEEAEQAAFVTPPGMITNLGDIVISWPTIEQQARTAGHDTLTELVYLLSHGVLHLIGYDDHTEAGYAAMVSMQQQVLKSVGQREYKG